MNTNLLAKLLVNTNDLNNMKLLLKAIFTSKELKEFDNRLKIFQLLMQGQKHREISENNFLVKSFSKSSIYTVIDRKSEQKSIENKLTEDLSSEITLQIIFEILKNTK